MKEFIELLILACLFINGLHFACDYNPILDECEDFWEARHSEEYKNVLWWLKWLLKRDLGEYWTRPILGCVSCMASVVGTGIWFGHGGSFYGWFPFILCLCGLNSIISKLTEKFS